LGASVSILSSGSSDIGRKRKTNQDSICLLADESFFAVADGMGGHSGGDIASQMSVKLFPDFLSQNKSNMEVPELLNQSIKFINRSIFDHGQKNQDLRGMGTTISALMFSDKFVNIANIGDSRVYMIHNKKLYQMTRDHSLVQEKLNLGIYDRQGAKEDPQKNVLIRTVGFEPEVEVDVYKYRISKSDLFLICSDGLHGKVCDEDIVKIVNSNILDQFNPKQKELDNAVKQLIDQANYNGGQDNISVILAITT
jgi:protein phosphatase